jgi:hypothetical protein
MALKKKQKWNEIGVLEATNVSFLFQIDFKVVLTVKSSQLCLQAFLFE